MRNECTLNLSSTLLPNVDWQTSSNTNKYKFAFFATSISYYGSARIHASSSTDKCCECIVNRQCSSVHVTCGMLFCCCGWHIKFFLFFLVLQKSIFFEGQVLLRLKKEFSLLENKKLDSKHGQSLFASSRDRHVLGDEAKQEKPEKLLTTPGVGI